MKKISKRITQLKPYILIYAYSLKDDEISLIKAYAKKKEVFHVFLLATGRNGVIKI